MTLNMNTSIPLPSSRIGTRVVLPIIVIGSALAILAWSSWRVWAPLTTVHAVPVIVRTTALVAIANTMPAAATESIGVARGPVVQAPGWIEPSPFPISASALIPGVVREVLVLEGDRVAEGQVVARLIDDQAKLELRRANAEVDIKAAELAVMRDELTRKSKLVAGGGVSEGEVVRLALRVRGAEASLEQVSALRDQAALTLARTEVRAPVAGVVMARLVAPGSSVGMFAGKEEVGTSLMQLFDPKSLQVRTDVPLADAGRLALGQTAEIQVDSLPGTIIRGHVLRLVQQADIAKNTLQVKVLLEDPPAGLVPDMLARVKIQTGAIKSNTASASSSNTRGTRAEMAAPALALIHLMPNADGVRSGQVRVVVDIRDQVGRIELRNVVCAIGADADGWTAVYEGLRPGDLVVLDDSPKTTAGEIVRVRDTPMRDTPISDSPATAPTKGEHDGHK